MTEKRRRKIVLLDDSDLIRDLVRETIGKVDVNFLSGPTPTARFTAPSVALADEKRQFGATRRQRWFGLP